MAESRTVPTNPLVRARVGAALSQADLAGIMQVSQSLIKFSEAGCYNIIPSCYRKQFPRLLSSDSMRQYQLFRRVKRRMNFTAVEFPEIPPNTMKKLLSALGLTPYSFAVSACVQHAEIHKLLQNKRSTLPSNLVDFFQTIDLPDDWILGFNKNMGRHETAVEGWFEKNEAS